MRIAVEDAHRALAVSDQLAQATDVQGRLVALVGVHVGEEPGQCPGPRGVERIELVGQQPVEVEPVETPFGLLHELEEVLGVGGRHHLARAADEPDVDAPDVAGEIVVGVVTVECLPRAVGWVVVAEALGGPRAAHDERARMTAHQAFDLERHAVAEALGIVGGIAPQRAQSEHGDGLAEHPREVLVEPGGPEREARGHLSTPDREDRAGRRRRHAGRHAAEEERATPVRPWVPMTIMPAFCRLAARTICSWATPSVSIPRARTRGLGPGEQPVHLLLGPGAGRRVHLVVGRRRDVALAAGTDRDDRRHHVQQDELGCGSPRLGQARANAGPRPWRNPWVEHATAHRAKPPFGRPPAVRRRRAGGS